MKLLLQNINSILEPFLLHNGENPTSLPFVKLYFFNSEYIDLPTSNRPYFYLIIEGEIIFDGRLGKTNYTDGEYFISKIDTPKSARIVKNILRL